ncbi:hypothetical protein KFK09_016438 [Dendrobium nobile]|uniref:Uncharacterized protein n=1 Tax=Dendrobium nobile TaxID=94219 RepID=A0A8T3AY90_DENNO|nr:hypothetical protein KFK09_016438 [Dendrobium nobile]
MIEDDVSASTNNIALLHRPTKTANSLQPQLVINDEDDGAGASDPIARRSWEKDQTDVKNTSGSRPKREE